MDSVNAVTAPVFAAPSLQKMVQFGENKKTVLHVKMQAFHHFRRPLRKFMRLRQLCHFVKLLKAIITKTSVLRFIIQEPYCFIEQLDFLAITILYISGIANYGFMAMRTFMLIHLKSFHFIPMFSAPDPISSWINCPFWQKEVSSSSINSRTFTLSLYGYNT